jgi:hypothetical protein
MTRTLAGCVLLAALIAGPGTSAADPVTAPGPAVYDTVDAVEVRSSQIVVTGIISGQSTTSEFLYSIVDATTGSAVAASRCDRLALLAIAKPGKYQFATTNIGLSGNRVGCKLIVRTP